MTGEVKRYSYAGAMHMPESPFGEYVTHAAHLAVVEGLRADAERYRWLRDVANERLCIRAQGTSHVHSALWAYYKASGPHVDRAIDEAMRGGDDP